MITCKNLTNIFISVIRTCYVHMYMYVHPTVAIVKLLSNHIICVVVIEFRTSGQWGHAVPHHPKPSPQKINKHIPINRLNDSGE